jgi:hypothetical protein
VDRTVDATAAEQARVRGVDDRVDLELGDVASWIAMRSRIAGSIMGVRVTPIRYRFLARIV